MVINKKTTKIASKTYKSPHAFQKSRIINRHIANRLTRLFSFDQEIEQSIF